MSPLQLFLDDARKHIAWRQARIWAVRGLAVVAVAALVIQLVDRWRPFSSQWPVLSVVLIAGMLLAIVGWVLDRPTLVEVARAVDRRLGGQERLTTALELAVAGEVVPDLTGAADKAHSANPYASMVDRQRADADEWARSADPRQAAPRGLPRRELAVALGAAALAVLLVALPNATQAGQRDAAEGEAAREEAAAEIEALADELNQGRPREDTARRQALVRELRQTREALLQARDIPAGVAALSRAQASLQTLADPSAEGRASSAAAAGAALAKSGAGAEAGAAMSKADGAQAEELEQLADALPTLTPEQQAAAAAELAAAAAAAQASSPAQAQSLRQAAEALASGQPEAAASALASVAQTMEAESAQKAADALEQLGASLPNLTPEQQTELAEALKQAASAAAADPALAEQLRNAAEATRENRAADAAAALNKAGERTQQLDAESRLDSDVSRASNSLQSTKSSLLSKAAGSSPSPGGQPMECGGDMSGHDHGVSGHNMSASATTVAEPPAGGFPGPSPSTTAAPQSGGGACPSSSGAGPPIPGEGKMPGAGASGGQSPGQGQGEGQDKGGAGGKSGQAGEGGTGAGNDSGGENGGNRGGGGSGASGALGQAPGLPSEQVFIPGVSGPGRTQSMPGSSSSGTDAPLVPYEAVYSQYRSEALSQADRQLMPERLRELLRQYFQETP